MVVLLLTVAMAVDWLPGRPFDCRAAAHQLSNLCPLEVFASQPPCLPS